ncbi:MAG: DUF971 domain-containing protein [Gallionella sp.]|nr:DUF971 domain-containing protein [Gallionella sp.]
MSFQPTGITLHQESRLMEIGFADGQTFSFPYEYLRVYSPSADVKGHFPGEEVLQVGKKNVRIKDVAPSGSYALQITFDDGHDSGIYTWEYLHELGSRHAELWHEYLERMAAANASRESKH